MQPYSPWQSPPNTGSLEAGDLASFEINGLDAETGEAGAADDDAAEAAPMIAAMQVLNQQSQIINKLLDMLSSKKGT